MRVLDNAVSFVKRHFVEKFSVILMFVRGSELAICTDNPFYEPKRPRLSPISKFPPPLAPMDCWKKRMKLLCN